VTLAVTPPLIIIKILNPLIRFEINIQSVAFLASALPFQSKNKNHTTISVYLNITQMQHKFVSSLRPVQQRSTRWTCRSIQGFRENGNKEQ